MENSNGYFIFGTALPDFVRNFIPGKKMFPTNLPQFESEYKQVNEGVLSHFDIDEKFHTSHYFNTYNQKVMDIIKPVFEANDIKRYWFASHILLELIIDRILMKQHPELIEKYYTQLELIPTNFISDYLTALHLESEDFLIRYGRFLEIQYVKKYIDDEALTYSLMRICMHAKTSDEWKKDTFITIQSLMPRLEDVIKESMSELKLTVS